METPAKIEPTPDKTSWRSYAVLLAVPFFLFVTIVCFAPNFVQTEGVRNDPLGGDFLQEYAGGVLFRDQQQNNQLYNVDVCREIQHDSQLLGFEWDESRFFPMVYPPFYYAAISPISKLPYLTALRLWLFAMVGFLVIGLLLLKRTLSVHNGVLLISCFAAPLLLSLTTGQKSSLLFLILSGTFCLLRSNKPFAAGVVFGLIAFKPHLGIPIGLFMLARRQWSFVLGCYFSVGCLIAASFATGFDICTDFYSVTMGFTDYVHNGGYHLEQGFSLWSAWQLAVNDGQIAKYATIAMTAIVLAGTVFVLRKPACHQGDNLLRSFSAMTIATVLVAPHLYPYDLAMLLLPTILLSHLAIRSADAAARNELWLPIGALVIVMFGMNPLVTIAAASGLNFGVVLMVIAWVVVLQSIHRQNQGETARSKSVTGSLQPIA